MADTEIKHRDMIGRLLESVHQHKLSIQMLQDSPEEEELSQLLALRPAENILVLDAPRGMSDTHFAPGQTLVASVWHNGMQLRFRLRIVEQQAFEGYPALITDWPSVIQSIQRRNAFRVRLWNFTSRADLLMRDGPQLSGRILDLSVGGFSTLLPPDAPLEIGQTVTCEIFIQGQTDFIAGAEIRNMSLVSRDTHLRVGAEFSEIEPTNRRRLEQLLREFEREQIRRLRGTNRDPEAGE